jgi:hypothetical protein
MSNWTGLKVVEDLYTAAGIYWGPMKADLRVFYRVEIMKFIEDNVEE